MDERRVADYFVVAGLTDNPEPLTDFSRDGTHLKPTHNQAPITDLAVIFPGLGENAPDGFTVIDFTPTGYTADLNHGSLRSPEVYLCIRRGWDKPPLVDIGVMYEGKERIMADSEVVLTTPGGRFANVNNSGAKTYVTYRRAPITMPCNELVVTDICVVLTSKGETAPHAFCMINKNLNKGIVGTNVFLCYKKSMNRANLISYKPGILARYPHHDHSFFPFPTSVPMFCLPMGSSMECWPKSAKQPRPVFSTFVLTVADASEKVYGSAITFYEQVSATTLTAEQLTELNLTDGDSAKYTVNINKSVCLLSHWPFFDTFEKFLTFIYELGCKSPPQAVPIERHISHFLECVPFPSPQRPHILVQLSASERVVLTQPEDLPLPRSGASFRELLMNLGSENCLMVLLLALTEQKLLVHSLRPNVLTAVAEAISMIMFPLKWQCPYIPLCPLGLAEVLNAPLPFLIGVDSRFFDLYDPPTDVTCIDLDTNHITICEDKRSLNSKLLPKKPARTLRNTLDQLYHKAGILAHQTHAVRDDSIDKEFQIKRKEQALELEIQEAFLRFMASALKGYRVYLLPITKAPTAGTTDPNSLFDLTSFLRSRDKTHHKFFTMLMRTQMFIRFIEERSFVSDMDAGLAFFDECTEKVDTDEGDGHLLELDESHRSERTVFILPPEPTGLPPGLTYTYKGFKLEPHLFGRTELKHPSGPDGRLTSGNMPGSPMARRTKHEIKSAQKLARKNANTPDNWAKCLLGTCYSLWFIHLPSYAMQSGTPRAPAVLRAAYEMLVRIQKLKLQPTDEVCYRVMMQLCGVYSQPVLAVKLLFHMKRSNVQPNAITYGFYNRAVLDSQWPSDCTNSSQLMWNKLRNVIVGVALFRRAGWRKREEEQSSVGDIIDGASRTSLESATSLDSVIDPATGLRVTITGVESESDHTEDPTHVAANASSTVDTAGLANQCSALGLTTNDNALDARLTDENIALDSQADAERCEGKPASRIVSATTDFTTFDRFRSRVGSIVRPSGMPLLSPNTLQQQSFESSAGLLMTGSTHRRKSILEDEDVFDSDLLCGDSPLAKRRQRYRTGSLSTEYQSFAGLRHAAITKSPTSPKESGAPDTNCPDLGMLIRSESFANDAQILSSLKRLKQHMNHADPNRITNNGHAMPPRDNDNKRFTKPSLSRSLFGRPQGTSNALGTTASVDSSTEHLSERSSMGSTDDLDVGATPQPSSHQGRFLSRVWDRAKSSSPNLSTGSLDEITSSDGDNGDGFVTTSAPCDAADRRDMQAGDRLSMDEMSGLYPEETDLADSAPSAGDRIHAGIRDGRNKASKKLDLSKRNAGSDVLHRDSRNKLEEMSEDVLEDSLSKNELCGFGDKVVSGKSSNELSSPTDNPGEMQRSLTPTTLQNKSSPVRTPVTENDPLGALDVEVELESNETSRTQSRDSSLAPGIEEVRAVDEAPGGPILFGGTKGVSRSATFTHDTHSLPANAVLESTVRDRSKPMHRSSTMPVDVTPPTASNVSSLGSGFKLPFSRYSPGRFSLRKEDLKIGTQFVGNAISNFSPSSLTSKKSNELLLGGFNSLKSAATSVAKKFDEIKEAMSTPVKTNSRHRGSDARIDGMEDDVTDSVGSTDPAVSASGGNQLGPLLADSWPVNLWEYFNDGSRKGSSSNLQPMAAAAMSQSQIIFPENLYPRETVTRLPGSVTAIELAMTTCSKCHHCSCVLYDEEIMAGWVPEDSNLNTKCQFCSKATVPFLTVIVVDFRCRPMASVRSEEVEWTKSSETFEIKGKNDDEPTSFTSLEPITVPYLNPLVLRKEFENILHCEGDSCLTQPKFVDEHPIIYWNMVWTFQRINVVSHLPGLSLDAATVNRDRTPDPSWEGCDHNNVAVRCMWDNPRLHEEVGLPMYVLWQQTGKQSALVSALVTDRITVSRGVMQHVIRSVRINDLYEPLKKMANERQKMKGRGFNRMHSIYRDILFLSMTVMGRENIDQTAFDREYVAAYERLPERDSKLYHRCDRPLTLAALCCRHYFRELQL